MLTTSEKTQSNLRKDVSPNHTTCHVNVTEIPNIMELGITSVSGLIINVKWSTQKSQSVTQLFEKTWWVVHGTEEDICVDNYPCWSAMLP